MANYDFTYTGTEIQAILDTGKKLKDSGYIFLGVATPSTNPGTPTQKVYYEAKQAGTYTNFGGIVLPAGLSLLIWNGSWTSNTVMCGDGGVFDISVYKASGGTLATFADLAAALNGGNNIPASARKGGMSVKFVQSSDNKYVQYRLMAASFSTTESDWQGVDDEPTAGSDALVKSSGIFDSYPYNMISPFSRVSISKDGKNIAVTFNGNVNLLSEIGKTKILAVSGQTYNIPNYYTLVYDFSDSSLKVVPAISTTTRYVNILQNENGNVVGGLLCEPYLSFFTKHLETDINGIHDIPALIVSPFERVSITTFGNVINVTWGINNSLPNVLLSNGTQVTPITESGTTFVIEDYYCLVYNVKTNTISIEALIQLTSDYILLIENEHGKIVDGVFAAYYNNIEFNARYNNIDSKVNTLETDINGIHDIPALIVSPFERISITTSGNVINVTWGIQKFNKLPNVFLSNGTQVTPITELGTNFVIENYYCLVYNVKTNTISVEALTQLTSDYILLIENEHGKIVDGVFAAYYNNIESNAKYNEIDSKVDTLETHVNDIYIENSGDISILPTKPEQLTDSVTWQNYFSPLPLFDMFYKNGISSIYIEYFIYKPAPGKTTMNLAIVSVPVDSDTVPTVLITEDIALQSSWLDNTYGDGVYKVPYNKRVNGIPAVRNIYFKQNISGIGLVDCTRSYSAQSSTSMSGEMFFGIIGKDGIGGKLVDSPWRNKSVCFLGDSITAHGHYVRAFQQITGAKVINKGISGTCMVMSDANTVNSFEQRVSGLDDSYDALIIAGGANDFRVDTCDWGNLSDGPRTGVYTFYAGLHRLFKDCANKYFGKPVAIMTPMHNLDNPSWGSVNLPEFIENQDGSLTFRTNPVSGKTLAEYVNAIKEVAAFYSLPVIDCYSASGMCPYLSSQRGTYYPTTDFLHPNSEGGVKIGRFITAHLDIIYKEFYQQYD